MGELWSFVDRKGHQQCVGLAMDADARAIVGCHVGEGRGHQPSRYGSRYRLCIDSVPKSPQTIGAPTKPSFPASVTVLLVKRVG